MIIALLVNNWQAFAYLYKNYLLYTRYNIDYKYKRILKMHLYVHNASRYRPKKSLLHNTDKLSKYFNNTQSDLRMSYHDSFF